MECHRTNTNTNINYIQSPTYARCFQKAVGSRIYIYISITNYQIQIILHLGQFGDRKIWHQHNFAPGQFGTIVYQHRKAVLLESVPREISNPIPSHPTHPHTAFRHLSLSMVIRNSASRPRQINVDQVRPKQVSILRNFPNFPKFSKFSKFFQFF